MNDYDGLPYDEDEILDIMFDREDDFNDEDDGFGQFLH